VTRAILVARHFGKEVTVKINQDFVMAVETILFLKKRKKDDYLQASEIAKALDFSVGYLQKVIQMLSRQGNISDVKNAVAAGVKVVQYRDKNKSTLDLYKEATLLRSICKKVIFIINDRLDIALAVGADGVHLGQEDIPYAYARKLLGREKIIGLSTHSLKQALFAEKLGADYISVGPVFATPTKPEYKAVGLSLIRKVKNKIRVPFVAIGGINFNNLKGVLNAGASRIAIVRAICKARSIRNTVSDIKLLITTQNA